MNTTLNPRIKLTVPAMSRGLPGYSLPFDDNSFNVEVPPIMHRYEGISGNTQGERNDNKPAMAQVSA